MARKYKSRWHRRLSLGSASVRSVPTVWVFALQSTTVLLLIYAIGVTLEWSGFGPIQILRETMDYRETGEATGLTRDVEQLPGKTLWDWMALVIPIEIPLLVYLLNRAQRKRELHIEAEHIQRSAVQSYFEQIKEMLLKESLRSSKEDEDVNKLAQTRTLLTLDGLDPNRKRTLLWFLYDLNLIKQEHSVISLYDAPLKDAYLADIILVSANLKGADLSGANLSSADLSGADLNSTHLSDADLSDADLTKATGVTIEYLEQNAKSLKGATMPDGAKHN